MRIVDKAEATASLADYAAEAEQEPVVVTSQGKPIAVLIAIENADLETISLSTNRAFIDLIERSRARQRAEGSISSEELRRRLGMDKTDQS
jgi:prevent-host-death family protein